MSDGTLRSAVVDVSFLNPQTNSYSKVGKTYVIAMRKSGTLVICILGPNKQPISALPVTASVEWTIQNEVYCSFVDSRSARYLLLFDTPSEARMFTLLALSAKVAAASPVCIVEGNGDVIPASDNVCVTFSQYDLSVAKIEGTVDDGERFNVESGMSSPLSQVCGLARAGSVFVVAFPPKCGAIVEVVGAASDVVNAVVEQQQPQQQERKQANRAKQAENAKMVVQKAENQQMEVIRDEMRARFRKLTERVAALRRAPSGVSMSGRSDVLVGSVQRLLRESQVRDQKITEQQELIDELSEKRADTGERDEMRIELGSLNQKLTVQMRLTHEKLQEQDRLKKRIEELEENIGKANESIEPRLAELQESLEDEKHKQMDELEKSREQLEWNVKAAEEEAVELVQKVKKAQSENKALKTQSSRDAGAELEKMKAAVPSIIQRTIRQMVTGVYEMIEQNFDEDEDYDGVAIVKAIRMALQTQLTEMLEQIGE